MVTETPAGKSWVLLPMQPGTSLECKTVTPEGHGRWHCLVTSALGSQSQSEPDANVPARPVPPAPALTHRAAAVVQQVVVPAVVALDLPGDALLGSCKRSDPLGEQQKKTARNEHLHYRVILIL